MNKKIFQYKKKFCIKFTSGQLKGSSFDNLSKNFRKKSRKKLLNFRNLLLELFFFQQNSRSFPQDSKDLVLTKLVKFFRHGPNFSPPDPVIYGKTFCSKQINSTYSSGQVYCRFDNHAEKFSPKFWYPLHNLQIYPSKGLFHQIKNSLEKVL